MWSTYESRKNTGRACSWAVAEKFLLNLYEGFLLSSGAPFSDVRGSLLFLLLKAFAARSTLVQKGSTGHHPPEA